MQINLKSWLMICSLLFCCCDTTCLFHFRRAHTLTVLIVLVSVLIYVAVFEPVRDDTSYNTKRYRYVLNRQTLLGVVLCEPCKVPDSNTVTNYEYIRTI
jgi:hypothetical protein